MKNLVDRQPLDDESPHDHEHLFSQFEVLTSLNMTLRSSVAAELIEDRLDLYNQNLGWCREAPPWMVLVPAPRLAHLRTFVDETLALDDRARQSFIELIDSGPSGAREANRILYHTLKDSEGGWRKGPSQYIGSCVAEAQEALANWQEWDAMLRASGSASRPSYGGSSSSSGWGNTRGFR